MGWVWNRRRCAWRVVNESRVDVCMDGCVDIINGELRERRKRRVMKNYFYERSEVKGDGELGLGSM